MLGSPLLMIGTREEGERRNFQDGLFANIKFVFVEEVFVSAAPVLVFRRGKQGFPDALVRGIAQ